MLQRACTNEKQVVVDEWNNPNDSSVFWKDQNNEMNSLVRVPAYCLGIRFVVDVVATTLLKTKPVSNRHPKTSSTNASMHAHSVA